jgi:hypothetical protein
MTNALIEIAPALDGYNLMIVRDDDIGHQLVFTGKRPIHIVTWKGYLAIAGPKGSYVFWKTPDMFRFFRMAPNDWNINRDGGQSVNPEYWHEKLVSKGKLSKNFIWNCYAIAWGIAKYDDL